MKTVHDYLIPTLTTFYMIWNEYENYLDYIEESMKISLRIVDVLVDREFPNVLRKNIRISTVLKSIIENRIISNDTSILIILYILMELEESKQTDG